MVKNRVFMATEEQRRGFHSGAKGNGFVEWLDTASENEGFVKAVFESGDEIGSVALGWREGGYNLPVETTMDAETFELMAPYMGIELGKKFGLGINYNFAASCRIGPVDEPKKLEELIGWAKGLREKDGIETKDEDGKLIDGSEILFGVEDITKNADGDVVFTSKAGFPMAFGCPGRGIYQKGIFGEGSQAGNVGKWMQGLIDKAWEKRIEEIKMLLRPSVAETKTANPGKGAADKAVDSSVVKNQEAL